MGHEHSGWARWARRLALAALVGAGLVSIVGSGGGIGASWPSICDTYPESCGPLPPTVTIEPALATVQVGSPMTFSARPEGFGDPTYRWQRSADGGRTFVDIPGATGASYRLAGANLGDDATVFHVVVRPRGTSGPVAEASSRLAVSSAPGIVFEDGDFPTGGWQVSEIAKPAANGAMHTEERVASGGRPDAFRRMTHTMPATQQSLGVMNLSNAAIYNPAVSGAIHVIDYSEDCALQNAGNPFFLVWSTVLIEQAGRRYRPRQLVSDACSSAAWTPVHEATSLARADFELLDGPACAAGQLCPDFSASAPPIRLGFVRFAQASTTPTVHGIDNWKVTVWRK